MACKVCEKSVFLLIFGFFLLSQSTRVYAVENGRQERLDTFMDWRFGIFIHWGIAAGYMNVRSPIIAEERKINAITQKWDERANKFDAKEWVSTFMRAGAKYINITAMHHTDFYLYPTKLGARSPKRDYLAELKTACDNHDLGLMFYFQPGGEGFREVVTDSFHNWQARMDSLTQLKALILEEMVERYQPFGLWMDGWPSNTWAAEKFCLKIEQVYDLDVLFGLARQRDPDLIIGNKKIYPDIIIDLNSAHIDSIDTIIVLELDFGMDKERKK